MDRYAGNARGRPSNCERGRLKVGNHGIGTRFDKAICKDPSHRWGLKTRQSQAKARCCGRKGANIAIKRIREFRR